MELDYNSLTPRTPEANELSKVEEFLNRNLRSQVTWAIGNEYPTAINEQNRHNMSIITDPKSEQILSHALVKTLIYKTPSAILRVGAIGSVVTDPSFRQHGLSKKNIQNCLSLTETQDCDIAILWTDQYDFYRKFGFELCGFEYTYQIATAPYSEPQNKNNKFIQGNKIDPQAILRLYNQHTVCGTRSTEDIRKFLQIPNSNVYTLWTPQNQLIAYMVEGKGVDLQNYIHEWGGNVNDLLDLLTHVMRSNPKTYTFMCPAHSVNLRRQLLSFAQSENKGFLGMIKLIKPNSVFQKIKKAFRAEGLEHIVLEQQDNQFLIGYGTDLYTLSQETDLVKLLFGQTEMSDLTFMKPETQKIFEKLLPLPLWIWGWDSV